MKLPAISKPENPLPPSVTGVYKDSGYPVYERIMRTSFVNFIRTIGVQRKYVNATCAA